jgi:hypothetical protein
MPDCFGKPAVTNACAFYQCTRGCGCAKHPAFPAPSVSRATRKARANHAARMLACAFPLFDKSIAIPKAASYKARSRFPARQGRSQSMPHTLHSFSRTAPCRRIQCSARWRVSSVRGMFLVKGAQAPAAETHPSVRSSMAWACMSPARLSATTHGVVTSPCIKHRFTGMFATVMLA